MSIGKYSPALIHKPMVDTIHGQPIDEDGYDMYGYDPITGKDRAGYTEDDYLTNSIQTPDEHQTLYDRVLEEWIQYGVHDE